MAQPTKPEPGNRRRDGLSAFFAYPDKDRAQTTVIERAIKNIYRQTGIRVQAWRKIQGSTSRIISNILEGIDKSDIVIGDLTDLNPNVLFQLGYAFGKQKSIMLCIQGNSTSDRDRDIKELQFLSHLHITSFQNADDITSACVKRYAKSGVAFAPEIQRYGISLENGSNPQYGLCLKGLTRHEIGLSALTAFQASFSQVYIDDWTEDGSQPLTWYLRSIVQSTGMIALFVNSSWDRSREINARFSFMCGLAHAFSKQVLMIGLPGFTPHFDYEDILKCVTTPEAAAEAVLSEFSGVEALTVTEASPIMPPDIEPVLPERATFPEPSPKVQLTKDDKELILLEINLGNTIAENEALELGEYFIETGHFRSALTAKQAIFVGSKGTGKTANFLQIRDRLSASKMNLVCEIKPTDYMIDGFLAALRHISEPQSVVGHVVESAWKMIMYAELLSTLRDQIRKLPRQVNLSMEQQRLVEFASQHAQIIDAPFEKKLDIAAAWLEEVSYDSNNFSRRIHEKFLSSARSVLTPLLARKQRTVILVDNLDKAWKIDSDLQLQAQLLFSLLGIHRKLRSDLGNELDISLIVFLRRNIFEYILVAQAREPDKLLADVTELSWDDQEMLLRLIEERFKTATQRNSGKILDPWATFFTAQVDGLDTKEWIFSKVLPRPRDLIHFVRSSIEWAINRNHDTIQADDLKTALRIHSAFALEHLVAEYQAEEPWLLSVLSSFAGRPANWSLQALTDHITRLGVAERYKKPMRDIVAVLVSIRFLGVNLAPGIVRFASTVSEGITLTAKVKNHPLSDPLEFVIHPVYKLQLSLVEQPLHTEEKVPSSPPQAPQQSTPISKPRFNVQQFIRRLFSITR